MIAYKDKIAAISSASPGALGGLRGLVVVRMMLSNIGVTVVPNQVAITQAHNAFDEDGKLNNNTQKELLGDVVGQLIGMTKAVGGN